MWGTSSNHNDACIRKYNEQWRTDRWTQELTKFCERRPRLGVVERVDQKRWGSDCLWIEYVESLGLRMTDDMRHERERRREELRDAARRRK